MTGQPAPEPTDMLVPFYRRGVGDALLPTPLTAGPPWLPGTQHGSVVAALMARATEATPSTTEMLLSRLTVDLSRSVPMGVTTVSTTVVRDGRRLQVLDVALDVDGTTHACGSALRLRVGEGIVEPSDAPAPWPDDATVTHPSEALLPSPLGPDPLWEAHSARWESYAPGDGSVWLRPRHPLVDGETPSPIVRMAAVADLVMSGGGVLPMDRYVVVNADLTLAVGRPPASEWIQLRSRVRVGPDGTGQSEGMLFDEYGWIGRALKSLLVDRR